MSIPKDLVKVMKGMGMVFEVVSKNNRIQFDEKFHRAAYHITELVKLAAEVSTSSRSNSTNETTSSTHQTTSSPHQGKNITKDNIDSNITSNNTSTTNTTSGTNNTSSNININIASITEPVVQAIETVTIVDEKMNVSSSVDPIGFSTIASDKDIGTT